MRVAILVENIALKAGTERAVINEANLFDEAGYNVCLISIYSHDGDIPAFQVNKSIKIRHLSYKFSWRRDKFITYAKMFISIPKIVKQLQADVVLGSSYILNYILAFGKFTAKTIGCEHFNYNNLPEYKKWIRKKAYPKLDAVVVLTQHDAKHYDFIKPEKLFVIPNSITNVPDGCCDISSHTIISVGRLTYQKGFDILLKVAEKVKLKLPDWKFEIWGGVEKKRKNCVISVIF